MTEMEETLTGFKCFCKIYVSFPRANGEFNEVKFCLIKKMIAFAFEASIVGGMTQQLRHQRRRWHFHHLGRLGSTPVASGLTLVVFDRKPVVFGPRLVVPDTTLARFGLKSVAIGSTPVVAGAVGSILVVFDWTLAALGTKLAQFGLKLEAFDSTLVVADPIAGAVGSIVAVLDWKPGAPGTKLAQFGSKLAAFGSTLVLLAATLAVSGLKLVVSGSKPAAAVHPVVPGYPGRYCPEPWWFLPQRTAP